MRISPTCSTAGRFASSSTETYRGILMTTSIDDIEPSVGPTTLRRITAAWPRRATIRTDLTNVANPEEYDADLLDYPLHLLPFAGHPRFLAATGEQRQRVNTLAWLAYNQRV